MGWKIIQNYLQGEDRVFCMFMSGIAEQNIAIKTELKSKAFYDRVTVHRNRFLVNKTNRCTEFQFYWYYDCTCFGQLFCPSSGVLSRTSALVHFKRSSQLHKMYQSRCTAKNSWWWAEKLPETCTVVIPIKLEFGASVSFIHKERISPSTVCHHSNMWELLYQITFMENWEQLKLGVCLLDLPTELRIYILISCLKI